MNQPENAQHPLFHEDIREALRTCVMALGGPKAVGVALWGTSKSPEKLGDKLGACLNQQHSQKLSLDELMWILRNAHDAGCHAGINFIARDAGYSDPQPLVVEDEAAQLQREYIESVRLQAQMVKRMEALAPRMKVAG